MHDFLCGDSCLLFWLAFGEDLLEVGGAPKEELEALDLIWDMLLGLPKSSYDEALVGPPYDVVDLAEAVCTGDDLAAGMFEYGDELVGCLDGSVGFADAVCNGDAAGMFEYGNELAGCLDGSVGFVDAVCNGDGNVGFAVFNGDNLVAIPPTAPPRRMGLELTFPTERDLGTEVYDLLVVA